MKRHLFDIVAFLGKVVIETLHNVCECLTAGIDTVFNFFVWILANLTRVILSLIDAERMDHAESVIEQYSMNRELEILGAISKVKEDAVERALWTPNHSNAMNILGNRLFRECDWETGRIHEYMKRVIESIPGLGYQVGNDDDDDDGIALEV